MRAPVLALVLLAAALVPLAAPAAAADSSASSRIDVDETIEGADTYVFSIRVDEAQGGFTLSAGSHFTVQGHYGPNATTQHATGLRGVLQYHSGLDCTPRGASGPDPCFMDASGMPIEDAWDTEVTAGGFTFSTQADAWAWASATGGIWWDEDVRFDVPAGHDHLTVRFLVSIPDAQRIDVNVHLQSPQAITLNSAAASDGGFAVPEDGFEPTLGADTAPAGALVDGRETVTVGDERLYAAFGPSWHGVTVAGPLGFHHNTAGVSSLAHEAPDGQRTARTALAAGAWSGILVPGSDTVGEHVFEANVHAGAGPEELYLIGYQGPNA